MARFILPSMSLVRRIIASATVLALPFAGVSADNPAAEIQVSPGISHSSSEIIPAVDDSTESTSEVVDTAVEFETADVSTSYVQSGEVSERDGDEQQIEALSDGSQSHNETTSHIARIDLEADVAVVGVTWEIGDLEPRSVHWRVLENETWSEWDDLELADAHEGQESRRGTEPVTLTNVDAVEVVAYTSANETVPGMEINVISSEMFAPEVNSLAQENPEPTQNPEPAETADESLERMDPPQEREVEEATESTTDDDANTSEDPVPAVTPERAVTEFVPSSIRSAGLNRTGTLYSTGMTGLSIHTRKTWCAARECHTSAGWRPEYMKKLNGAVVHHTAGSNNYLPHQVPHQIRSVWHYQAKSLGWDDIGYNLIVDRFGRVWEGRYGGLAKAVIGAHARRSNHDTLGITILGNFQVVAPPPAARKAVAKAIAWKFDLHGVSDATSKSRRVGSFGGVSRTVTVSRVMAHREVSATACPGNAFYPQMNLLRKETNEYLRHYRSTKPPENRVAGSDRFETAVRVSQATYSKSSTVLLARHDEYADALAAGPLAARLNAPILLVNGSRIDPKTRAEIVRLGAKTAIPIGGTAVVPNAVARALPPGVTLDVDGRIEGANRYETSLKIAQKLEELAGKKLPVMVATGKEFADALSAGPAAIRQGASIVLYDSDRSASKLTGFLKERQLHTLGGGATHAAKRAGMKPAVELVGSDRFATSRLIAQKYFPKPPSTVYLATGMDFPDGLAASVLAGKKGSPLLLSLSTILPPSTRTLLTKGYGRNSVVFIGGPGVLAPGLATEIRSAASPVNA